MNLRMTATSILGVLFLYAAAVPMLVTGDEEPKAQVTVIRYDAKAKGIVVELSAQTPYQLIQVDETEILLAFKHGQALGDISQVDSHDPMVKGISTGHIPGNIFSLVIHTRNPVIHEKSEWLNNSSHLLISFKS